MIGNPNNKRREEFRKHQTEINPRFPKRARLVLLEDGTVVSAAEQVKGTVIA